MSALFDPSTCHCCLLGEEATPFAMLLGAGAMRFAYYAVCPHFFLEGP